MKIPWASFGYIRPRDFRLNVLHEEMHHRKTIINYSSVYSVGLAQLFTILLIVAAGITLLPPTK